MKNIISILLICLYLTSCTNDEKLFEEEELVAKADTTFDAPHQKNKPTTSDTLCFEHREGLDKDKQDINEIKLIFVGNEVKGNLAFYPFEKDAMVGTVEGRRIGNDINLTYNYEQEGQNSSMEIHFRLEGNTLYQQQETYDPQTGELKNNPKALYNILYKKLRCK